MVSHGFKVLRMGLRPSTVGICKVWEHLAKATQRRTGFWELHEFFLLQVDLEDPGALVRAIEERPGGMKSASWRLTKGSILTIMIFQVSVFWVSLARNRWHWVRLAFHLPGLGCGVPGLWPERVS